MPCARPATTLMATIAAIVPVPKSDSSAMGENHTPGDLYALDDANHAGASVPPARDGTLAPLLPQASGLPAAA